MDDELFTATQFANALGISSRRVEERLSPQFAQVSIQKGLPSLGWPVKAIPIEWLTALEKLRKNEGCRDLCHLLRNPPKMWRPGASSASPGQTEKAKFWQNLLSELLFHYSSANVRDIARKARDRATDLRIDLAVSTKTIERVIARARDRAGNRRDFERVELYLDEGAARATLVPKEPENGSGAVRCPDEKAAFLQAFEKFQVLVTSGIPPKAARLKSLDILASIIPVALTRNALRKQFDSKLERWKERGKTRLALEDDRKLAGRKAKFTLTKTEMSALRLKVLEKSSLALAIEYFVEDPNCTAGTRALILDELDRSARSRRKPQWPPSLRRAGRPTDDEAALFRGAKHFADIEFCVRRDDTYLDENGNRLTLKAGTLYESDDMSLNQPFRYIHPETGRMEIGRQSLCTMDVHSGAWLGGSPVGRSRDAYRAEDIADHLLAVVQAHGLPLFWRLERGTWENKIIDGLRLSNGEYWGGLDALFSVLRTHKSRGKGLIETSFRPLQDHMAHESTEIGRFRGEFEGATKKLTRLATLKDEAERDRVSQAFWDISAAADGMAKAMMRMNARPRRRRMLGREMQAPDDLRQGVIVRECPVGQLWRFCPVKRFATVRGGHVEVSVEHYPLPFRFQLNGVDGGRVYFEYGHKVLIAFHPGRPEEGCHIFNNEVGSRNRDGLAFGDFMLVAPMAVDSPQFNLRPEAHEFNPRKISNASVRTEFRAVKGVGQKAARSSTVQDGWGNRAERIEGGRYKERAAPPISLSAKRKAQGMEMMNAAREQPLDLEKLAAREAEYCAREGIYE